MIESEAQLLGKLEKVIGYVPIGTKDLLQVLAHPDVIDLTQVYLDVRRLDSDCDYYDRGWTCIKEAQARAEAMVRAKVDVTYILPIPWCPKCTARAESEQLTDGD